MSLVVLDKNWSNEERSILKDFSFLGSVDKTQYNLCREEDVFVRFPGEVDSYFKVDFLDGKFLFRLKTLSKNQPLFKALNISKKPKVLDATAGWGKDAVTFAYFGCEVLAFEENPVVYLLLKDGLDRAFGDKDFSSKIKGSIVLEFGNSREMLLKSPPVVDSIYIDPMYPHEDTKSALPKKEILFLRDILPESSGLEELLRLAIQNTKKRVVLKRPVGSEILLRPTHSFTSKMVRFDLYIP